MIYSNKNKEYLEGKTFSNGEKFHFKHTKLKKHDRDSYLIDSVRNKRILHFGFVDHLPLVDKKIKHGQYLHQKLMDVADVYGADINKEGIDYLKEKYSYDNIYAFDLRSDEVPKELLSIQFDYILLPDIIEHIGNPVEFIELIRLKFKNNANKIILTTPNSFRLNNVISTLKNVEIINTDHRFWFTPYTLSKVITDAGYKIETINFLEHQKKSLRQPLRNLLLFMFKAFQDTLVLEARFR